MTTLLIVLILSVFVAALYGFYRMQQKHLKFSTRVFTALFAGIIFGGALQLIFGTEDKVVTGSLEWMKIVGKCW